MDDGQSQQNQGQTTGSSQSGGTLVEFPKQGQGSVQSPVSIPQKEAEPIPSSQTEWVAPSEQAPELEPEVIEAGVSESKSNPKLSTADKIAGIEESLESIPVAAATSSHVKYPLTKEEAEEKIKGQLLFKDPSKAVIWLAMLILRQLKMKKEDSQQI